MAEFNNTKHIETVVFTTEMNKDLDPQLLKEGQYTHAINSQLNTKEGQIPFISNEEGTKFCSYIPYTFIGSIPLKDKRHAIFSTDNTKSEIGILDENSCKYTRLVNNNCLNFNTQYLIKGVSKENQDCSESIYWCDNYNNNRTLNINNIPYTYTFQDDTCKTKIYSDDLDCKELELNPLIKIPNIKAKKSNTSGKLKNGTYQLSITYSVKNQSVTDFYGTTLPVSIFTHENFGSAIDVEFENLDTDFEEFNLHIIATIAQQTTVYQIGTYSTRIKSVLVSNISDTDLIVPLSNIYLQRIINSKAENVTSINNQLLWSAPTTKPDLDYQLTALKIKALWVAYAVPIEDKNANIQSYMRDEVYALSLAWKYTDGTRTNNYVLVNREATEKELEPASGDDAYELYTKGCVDKSEKTLYWKVYNTATGSVSTAKVDNCDYKIIGTGDFGYHESTEVYPDNTATFGKLACTPIRHFRFPDDSIVPRYLKDTKGNITHVIHLGVMLTNVQHPKDSKGNRLNNIQGFEVFRSDRSTEKTILGKGLLFNMAEYNYLLPNKKTEKALYPNYPYNDLRTDKFLSKTQTKGSNFKEENYTAMGTYAKNYFSFHSPEFSFSKPSFGQELKIEGVDSGVVNATFEQVYNHPKNKLITDIALIVASVLGIGEAYLATRQQVTKTKVFEAFNLGISPGTGTTGSVLPPLAITAGLEVYENAVNGLANNSPSGTTEEAVKKAAQTSLIGTLAGAISVPYSPGRYAEQETTTNNTLTSIPKALRILNDIYLFAFYFQKGTETGINLIKEFAKSEQYAYQVNSSCNYTNFTASRKNNKRRFIEDISYLYPTIQSFDGITVNNYRRESAVILKLNKDLANPSVKDNSRQTISEAEACSTKSYQAQASSYYASIKQKLPAQYGQIQNIKWLNTGYYIYLDSTNYSSTYSTDVILGGDIFISKFSIKRKMHYFNQQAFGENENFAFNYRKYINIPYPRYWMDTDPYDLSEFVSLDPKLPNDKYFLDCRQKKKKIKDKLKAAFIVRDKYFYITNAGILNFYVESEINLNNRDWEEDIAQRHYDENKYSDINQLLRTDRLEMDNRYIYDKSYSKQLTERVGFTQNIYFNPLKEETCFTKHNNRVYWSLPNNKQLSIDNWRQYLTNNYYEFPPDAGKLIGFKSLDRTNIAFFFTNSSPYLHQAIDQLQTEDGIKLTIGDGALFARQPQPIATTDIAYGNSTSKYVYTNSQFGIFYPSINQGRVFLLQGNNLKEITKNKMSFWFKENLPLNITKDYPNFKDTDNTVTGVGCITIFDNTKELFYLTKIDYKVKDSYKDILKYDEDKNQFYILKSNGFKKIIEFKDSFYFEDCSWTISYNPSRDAWISFHDWHPNSVIQTENHFIGVVNPTSTEKCSLWKHGELCNKYCNYYGKQYSWDIEYVINNMQNTSTLSNVEYVLECYKYDDQCSGKHHLLDYNFNKAFIYTTEQHSGELRLNLAAKNKLSQMLTYPKVNTDYIDIEYSKEEQKYRFNQFWDVTKDRSEFNTDYKFPILYEKNKYRYTPNPDYLNYKKPIFERKKLRNNWFKVYLSKEIENRDSMPNMIAKFFNNKELNSSR